MTAVENVSLVRERSSPAVYLVVGDAKFWIVDSAEFAALGFRAERVRVVNDGSLRRYRESRLHAPPTATPSAAYFNCPKKTFTSVWQRWYCNCREPSNLVRNDVLVAGWLRDGQPYFNRAPHGLEDVHYDIVLDAVFLERMYGPDGLSNALVPARWPGHPHATPLPLATVPAPPGGQRGVQYSSWFLPEMAGGNDATHPELQAWHVYDHPATVFSFSSHWQGRGTAPAHWRPLPDDDNAWFPFDPRDPRDTADPLTPGDYIVMRGSLFEDLEHAPGSSWESTPNGGHGWHEIHPPDWIERVAPPSANLRLTAVSVAVCTPGTTGPEVRHDPVLHPGFEPATPSHYLQARRGWGEVQSACTDGASISGSFGVVRHDRHVNGFFGVAPFAGRQGRMKGAVFAGWAERDVRDEVWVDDAVPAGAAIAGTAEIWDWTGEQPGPFTGNFAHRSAPAVGLHQHYFWGATQPIVAQPEDRLFTMVHLDPRQPPDELMVQFFDGTWEHRAFWGDDRIGWGVSGTASRWRVGDIPSSGEWARLEVDARDLGLVGTPISGAAFGCFNGAALWDCTGLWRAPRWQDVGHANGVVGLAALGPGHGSQLYAATADTLWTRPAGPTEVNWTQLGPLPTITGFTGDRGLLWYVATDNGLRVRVPLPGAFATRVGHANDVVALAATGRMLYCVTSDDRLWVRPPVRTDVNWTPIGSANRVVKLCGNRLGLLGSTTDGRLWQRSPSAADAEWRRVGWGPAGRITGLAVVDGHIYTTTQDNRLWRRPC